MIQTINSCTTSVFYSEYTNSLVQKLLKRLAINIVAGASVSE